MAARTQTLWTKEKAKIERTFRLWGVTSWSIQTDVKPARYNLEVQEDDSKVAVTFTLSGRRYRFETQYYTCPAHNLGRLAEVFELIRGLERKQTLVLTANVIKQMYPDLAEPSHTVNPPTESDIYHLLHIQPNAPEAVVKAAYRALALLYHPDRGGSVQRMAEINNAYSAWQEEHQHAD